MTAVNESDRRSIPAQFSNGAAPGSGRGRRVLSKRCSRAGQFWRFQIRLALCHCTRAADGATGLSILLLLD